MNDMELLILQQAYKNQRDVTTSFLIDKFLGGDLKIQVDVGLDFISQNVGKMTMQSESKEQFNDIVIDENGVYEYYASGLNQNEDPWRGNVTLNINLQRKIDFLSLKVTSKPPSDTLPIRTRCWTSTGFAIDKTNWFSEFVLIGSETVSVESGDLLYILAEVKQGANPVIGARIKYSKARVFYFMNRSLQGLYRESRNRKSNGA